VSILGNLNVILMVGSRLPFAMAEGGQLPEALGRIHPRYRTPHVAIIVSGVLMLLLALTGTFVYAATISVIARLLSYAATCAALPVLRRKPGTPPALFRIPGGAFIVAGALILVAWLLSHVTLPQARDAGIFAAAGIVVYLISQRRQRRKEQVPS
jgi:amino acid transporter